MKVQVKFVKHRDTKNAVLYNEVVNGDGEKVGSLYIKKTTFGGPAPDKVSVDIEWE